MSEIEYQEPTGFQYDPAPSLAHLKARADWSTADHAKQRRAEELTHRAWQEVIDQHGPTTSGSAEGRKAHDPDQTTAQRQWQAAMTSPFKGSFQAPDLLDSMERSGRRETPPDMNRLVPFPGAPPDTVIDPLTGEVYAYTKSNGVIYSGNITNPQYTELQRGATVVFSKLFNEGRIPAAIPRTLPKDHGWKHRTMANAPGLDAIRGIDAHAPSIDDIANFVARDSQTAWAQIDRGTARAIGIGSVAAMAASAGVAGMAVPALTAGMGMGGAALVGGGLGAGAAGTAMLAGQLIGQTGDIDAIDWRAVTRSALGGAASGALSPVLTGVPAVGGGPPVGGFFPSMGLSPEMSQAFGTATRSLVGQGTGRVIPPAGQNITAFAPHRPMTPDVAASLYRRYTSDR